MKLLLKVAILILTARVLAGTPRGTNKEVDAIGDFSLRDIAQGITTAVSKTEDAIRGLWSEPPDARPKVATRRGTGESRPANSSWQRPLP